MSEVVVLGASGNVGSALTRRLALGGTRVRAFYDPSTPQRATFPEGVEELHGSFDDAAALTAAIDGARAVFLLTPPSPSQVAWQRAVIDTAVARGVPRVVKLSAFESGADSALHMGRWHHDGELALRASGLQWAILRPQYFMQNLVPALRRAAQSGEWAGAAAPDTRLGIVDVEDIAAVAAVVLTRDEHRDEVLTPTGPEALSFAEMAAALAHAAGREIGYRQRPAGEVAAEFSARGWPAWHVEDYLKIHGEAASALVTGDVAAITGAAPGGFAAFLAQGMNFPPSTLIV
jgi:NAD(P)H dehydrogenase (quinone)